MAFLVDKRKRLQREETYLNDEIETARAEQNVSAKKRELFETRHPGIVKAAHSAGRFGSNVATGIAGLASSQVHGYARRQSAPRYAPRRRAKRVTYAPRYAPRRRAKRVTYAPRRRHRRSSNSGGGILNARW